MLRRHILIRIHCLLPMSGIDGPFSSRHAGNTKRALPSLLEHSFSTGSLFASRSVSTRPSESASSFSGVIVRAFAARQNRTRGSEAMLTHRSLPGTGAIKPSEAATMSVLACICSLRTTSLSPTRSKLLQAVIAGRRPHWRFFFRCCG